jgi:hypothetical protein
MVREGDRLLVVGYGLNAAGEVPMRRASRTITVNRVGPQYAMPESPAIPAYWFETGEGTCRGDSGGPALDPATGAIVGIVSSGGNPKAPANSDNLAAECVGAEVRDNFVIPSGFKAMLADAFAAAGDIPKLETRIGTTLRLTGEVCANASDCEGNMCLASGTSRICSQSCNDDRECPGGFACTSQQSGGLCLPNQSAPQPKGTACAVRAPGAASSESACALLLAAAAMTAGRRRNRRR